MVGTSLAQCFSRVDVATMVSHRDLVIFPFYSIMSHDLSSLSGLIFFIALHVATLVLGCDHISASTAYFLGCNFLFSGHDLVCGFLPSQVSNLIHDLKLMSRPLLMFISLLLAATSILCCNQFLLSNLYAKLRPQGDVATSCCSFSGCM